MSGPAIYTATDRERRLATEWHGGQASMLYAVSSTGALTRGTVRPYGCETDAAWAYYLAGQLDRELAEVIDLAVRDLAESETPDPDAKGDADTAAAWRAKLAPIGAELETALDAEGDA